MNGNYINTNEKVICCFCGETLYLKDAAILIVQINFQSDEKQQLFCHKNHFVERINKSIPIHPDFFEEEV